MPIYGILMLSGAATVFVTAPSGRAGMVAFFGLLTLAGAGCCFWNAWYHFARRPCLVLGTAAMY
jgi:hypothetical protein